jgi:anaerobic magnesium-protoporphyrin IX monomethyl ester cyclase
LTTREAIDALFVPFYTNVDRWHNDGDTDLRAPSLARSRATLAALSNDEWMKDEIDVVIDGKLLDFSRFLSWTRYDTTAEHPRYDPFSMTLLAGSYYLNFLHQQGFRVRVANALNRHNLVEFGARYSPRFVLLSTTLLFDASEQDVIPIAIQQIRRCWPDAVIVLGGLMLVSMEKLFPPAVFCKRLLAYGADAYVVSPRGESSLLEILRRGSLARLVADPNIPATYVVVNGEVQAPSGVPEGQLPFESTRIRWNQLPQTDHLYHTVHMRTARSCAFACAFCEYPVSQGPLTLMPSDGVEQELRDMQALGGVKSIIFTDDTFNVPLARFKELLKVIAKFDFEWYSFFRPQYADEETARLMKAANCRAVFAGLESVDDGVLKNMNKRATATAYKRGIEHLKNQGIAVHANFIIGFPGDTERTARKIVSFLDDVGVDFFTVCTWAFIPSTPIGQKTEQFGIKGFGMQWTHDTMTSSTAQVLARQIAQEQKYAIHNSVRGEAWVEFLLYANGFGVDEVRLAIDFFNSLTERDNAGEAVRASPRFQELRTVLARHELSRPRLW